MACGALAEARRLEESTVPPIITLLTDFGTADGYVGEMKGIILSAVPDARLVDVSHDLGTGDVDGARLALARYWLRFPADTIHLVVVDPGVGTERRPIAVSSGSRLLVGPDNGALSPALLARGAAAFELVVPDSASPTFHGRDVFAPAVVALAGGALPSSLGKPVDGPVIRRTAEPHRLPDGSIEGEVVAIDRFGNAITNCLGLKGGGFQFGEAWIPLQRTYGDVASGALVAVIGSNGLAEISERDGSAARRLGLVRGSRVVWRAAPISG